MGEHVAVRRANFEIVLRHTNTKRDIVTRSFDFALNIVRLCRYLDGHSHVGRLLLKQLLRSGTSIGANVEEGRAGQSKADFINKNAIALKEARETRYWLRLLSESGVVDQVNLDPLINEAGEISRILGAIVSRAKH